MGYHYVSFLHRFISSEELKTIDKARETIQKNRSKKIKSQRVFYNIGEN